MSQSGVDSPAAVVDLLAVLAYGELSAFQRLAADARFAPGLADKVALSTMAVAEFGHFRLLYDRLAGLGVDPEAAMGCFLAPLDEFHELTDPADWLEGLVKAYVGDGFAADFYREIAGRLDPDTRALVRQVLDDTGHAAFVVDRVRAAIAAQPAIGGRLALWARRLVGEALGQAQRIAAERPALAGLLVGDAGAQAAERSVRDLFTLLTDRHAERMRALGLAD
jgi:hypothetical protein